MSLLSAFIFFLLLCFALLPPALMLRSLEIKNNKTNWHLRGMVIARLHMYKGYKYQGWLLNGWEERTRRCIHGTLTRGLALFQADAAACHPGLALLAAQPADVGCRLKLREAFGQGDDIRLLFLKFECLAANNSRQPDAGTENELCSTRVPTE